MGFILTDIAENEPFQILAGDFITWKRTLDDYPADDSWVLTYAMVTDGARILITASADGADHLVELALATTAAYTAGKYKWQAVVTNGTERYLVDSGELEVVVNYASDAYSSGLDDRTHIQIVLDALEAVIENRATKKHAETVVSGEVIARMDPGKLLFFYHRYKAYQKQAERAERVKAGLGHTGNIYVRF